MRFMPIVLKNRLLGPVANQPLNVMCVSVRYRRGEIEHSTWC